MVIYHGIKKQMSSLKQRSVRIKVKSHSFFKRIMNDKKNGKNFENFSNIKTKPGKLPIREGGMCEKY